MNSIRIRTVVETDGELHVANLPCRKGDQVEAIVMLPDRLDDENTYECRVLLCPEKDGGYSAHALRLPGVVSQGESKEEALENIADAFRAAISVYREQGEAIPWTNLQIDRPERSIERWILVNV